jgi:hypothetical protein
LTEKEKAPNETSDVDDSLVDYLESVPTPLPPRSPIGPPDVQPGETPLENDE